MGTLLGTLAWVTNAFGSHPMSYTAVGEQVGMAQRIESVAPPGEVMLSESTARLVRDQVTLGDPEMVRIKGSEILVPARRLHGTGHQPPSDGRRESPLIGRAWETDALAAVLERATRVSGAITGLVGPPGIGKSRLAREAAATARGRGIEVFSTYCESHTREIPFLVVARLLRAVFGVNALPPADARSRIRSQLPHADDDDLLLLNDLLGMGDTEVALPDISPDARRRRLSALLSTAALERSTPATYVIEDVHWIDEASESLLADFTHIVAQTRSLGVITYRPEYHGQLCRGAGFQAITLAPPDDSHTTELVRELTRRPLNCTFAITRTRETPWPVAITQRSPVRILSPLLCPATCVPATCPRYKRKRPSENSPGAVFMPPALLFADDRGREGA